MQTAMVCTLQKPPQRQRWGERPEGRSGSTGERGRGGEQRQDRGRPCRFLGGESAGGHGARRAADREGVSAAPSPPRRESRAPGEGAARHTEPAEAPGPAQAGAAPQGHPPCRAERRRPHVTRALGAAPGGAPPRPRGAPAPAAGPRHTRQTPVSAPRGGPAASSGPPRRRRPAPAPGRSAPPGSQRRAGLPARSRGVAAPSGRPGCGGDPDPHAPRRTRGLGGGSGQPAVLGSHRA